MEKWYMLIDGKEIQSDEWKAVIDPYSGVIVGEVAYASYPQLEMAVQAAVKGFAVYKKFPLYKRVQILRNIAEQIEKQAGTFAELIKSEAGKPIKLATAEVDRAIQTFLCAVEELSRPDGSVLPLSTTTTGSGRIGITQRFPIGPILAITPFNFPLNLVAHKLAPALASGNSIVIKPASQTPRTALLLGKICIESGLPPGTVNVVPCKGTVAEQLVLDERLKMLTFTGSGAVGWGLKSKAGKKKVTLELGGNAAAIVEPDVPLEGVAERLIVGAFAYAGQICISLQRIFVHESIQKQFLSQFVTQAENSRLWGDTNNPEVICGPLIDEANRFRILQWIDEAETAGAQKLCGGKLFGPVISPAVLTSVPRNLPIAAQEAFGPVVIVESYKTLDEAIQLVNESRYGLQASIYTNDTRSLMKAFNELEVGGVIHNDYPTFRVDAMPYGGIKDSGFGREGVRYAIEEMSELKLLVIRQ